MTNKEAKPTMRTADLDLLFIAGLGGSGPDHWQTRWRSRLPTARLVEQADWDRPDLPGWVDAVVAASRRRTASSASRASPAHSSSHSSPSTNTRS